MMAAVEAGNADAEPDMRMHVAIGVGYGPTLYVSGVDVWGDQANRAFKLGEDIAEPGEILVTAEARAAMNAPADDLTPYEVSFSGVTFSAFRAVCALT